LAWFNEQQNRLAIERRAIAQSFPQMEFFLKANQLYVRGAIHTGYGKTYDLIILYPDTYPYEAPKVFSGTPLKANTPHRFRDGSLCVHYNEWSPSYTVIVAIGWAAHWFHAYDAWVQTGDWPGKEVSHG
jgi:ubiquitin-protein ligase